MNEEDETCKQCFSIMNFVGITIYKVKLKLKNPIKLLTWLSRSWELMSEDSECGKDSQVKFSEGNVYWTTLKQIWRSRALKMWKKLC